MSDSGAPASTSAADTASVRGVAFGWANVAVSITMPGHQGGGERSVAFRRAARRAGPPAASPSRRSRRCPARSSPPSPTRVVRGVMVDHDPRQPPEQLRVAATDRPDPIERAAVGDDEQVVVDGRVGVVPGPRRVRQEVVQRRHGVGEDRGRGRAAQLDEPANCERGTERVGVGVLVTDRENAAGGGEAFDDAARGRRRATASGRSSVDHRRRLPGTERFVRDPGRNVRRWQLRPRLARAPRASAAAPPRPSVTGSARRSRAIGVGRVSPSARLAFGRSPRLDLVEQVQDPRPALERLVELEVELRDPLQPEPLPELVADERHRPARSPRSSSRRSSGGPITLTQTLAWRRSGAVSTSVIVAKPIRGSSTSRLRIDADLLAEAARRSGRSGRSSIASGRVPRHVSSGRTRLTLCDVKHSMMSPSSRSL